MKPISIKIDGINSYRKAQTIELNKLTQRGIFGIFGKTGSGKSSILDSIILALYAEIPRKTKDFVNSSSDSGNISFEFEITVSNKTTLYRVERKFKNTKSGGVSNVNAKLIKVAHKNTGDTAYSEVNEVIAEKKGEVDRAIVDIIGIGYYDFTRSVVLPQGQFNEFLTLTGKEKRDMLERLFSLDRYGSALQEKVKNEVRTAQEELKTLKDKLAEYENVSNESLTEKKEIQKNYKASLKILSEELKKLEEKDRKMNRELERIKEFRQIAEKYKLENDKYDRMVEEKESLDVAKVAGEILDIVKLREKDSQSYKEIENKLEIYKKNLEKLQVELERLEAEKITLAEKEKKIPELIKKEALLKNGIEMENKRAKTEKLSKEAQNTSDKLEELKEKHLKTEKELGEYINKNEEKITRKKEERKRISLSAEERENLQDIFGKRGQLSNILDYLDNITEVGRNIKIELESVQKELAKSFKNEEAKRVLLLELKKYIDSMELEKENIRKESMSKYIRASLKGGDVCPVCGNIHRPEQNSGILAEIDRKGELEAAHKNGRTTKDILADINRKISVDKERYENENKEYLKLSNYRTSLETKQAELYKKLYEKRKEYKKADEKKEQLTEEINGKLEVYSQNRCENTSRYNFENVDELIMMVTENDKKISVIETEINKIEADIGSKKIELDSVKIKINEIKNSIVAEKAKKERFDEDIREYEKELSSIFKTDDYNSELRCISKEIEDIQEKSKTVKEKYDNEVKNIQSVKEYISELKIRSATLDGNIKNYSNQALKEASRNEYMRNEGISENYDEKFTQFIYRNAKSESEIALIRKNNDDYFENIKKLKNNYELIENEVKGYSTTEEEYEKFKVDFNGKKEKSDVLNRESAMLENEINRLEDNLKKVKDLLKKKQEADERLETAEELQNVLKGNRFIEYVARNQLEKVVIDASERLGHITSEKYSIEIDNELNFYILDNMNGGQRRSISSLSGGETFVTSLSLAIALSSHIQLKGKSPLEFFFLDEGFGSLDSELLETVIESLEKLHSSSMSIGIISHVEELKNRVPVKLLVDYDEDDGSTTKLEYS